MSAEDNTTGVRHTPSKFQQTMQRTVTGAHALLYRLSGGSIGGRMFNAPTLLLVTTGRKTGKQRTTPLLYLADGDNLVLVASNGGADWSPSWWVNLKSNPKAQVQIGRQVKQVTARQASPEEKSRLWPSLTAMYPGYANYQQRTTRDIPVVILEPMAQT